MKTPPITDSFVFNHTHQRLQQRQKPDGIQAKPEATIEEHASHDNVPEIWLSKPKFLTQNKLSNSNHVTETSHKLLSQLGNQNITNKLRNGLSEVGELLNKHVGERGYDQTLSYYWGYAHATNSSSTPSLNIQQFKDDYSHVKQRLEFSLTTQSGKHIEFSLRYGANHKSDVMKHTNDLLAYTNGKINFSEISISFQQSDTLNEEEQKEITKLTKNMEQFFTDFFEKDQANFSLLRLSEFNQIQDLRLRAENPMSSSGLTSFYGLSFEYHSNQDSSHIKTSFKNNYAEMRISKAEPFNKSLEHRQEALQHYLNLLDQSKEKSQTSQMQTDMMKNVFKLAFQPTQKEVELLKQQTSGYKKQINKAGDTSENIKIKEIFIPLPDFSFEFKSNKSEKREHENPRVISEFDLKLSLESTQTQNGSKTIRQQKQHFELEGSYTKAMDTGTLKVDHKYIADKIVRAELEAGLLKSATISEDNFADVHKRFYGLNPKTGKNELLHEEHKITRHISVKDITEWLVKNAKQDPSAVLKEVLIDPFKEGEVIYYKQYHYLDKYYATHPYHFPLLSNAKT